MSLLKRLSVRDKKEVQEQPFGGDQFGWSAAPSSPRGSFRKTVDTSPQATSNDPTSPTASQRAGFNPLHRETASNRSSVYRSALPETAEEIEQYKKQQKKNYKDDVKKNELILKERRNHLRDWLNSGLPPKTPDQIELYKRLQRANYEEQQRFESERRQNLHTASIRIPQPRKATFSIAAVTSMFNNPESAPVINDDSNVDVPLPDELLDECIEMVDINNSDPNSDPKVWTQGKAQKSRKISVAGRSDEAIPIDLLDDEDLEEDDNSIHIGGKQQFGSNDRAYSSVVDQQYEVEHDVQLPMGVEEEADDYNDDVELVPETTQELQTQNTFVQEAAPSPPVAKRVPPVVPLRKK